MDHELDLVKYFAGSTRLKLFSLSRVYWEAAAFQGGPHSDGNVNRKGHGHDTGGEELS